MVHGWMEELVDNLLYLGVVIGLLIFSICYWREAYQLRCAELVTEEFLYIVTADGRITVEEYENFAWRLNQMNAGYVIELKRTGYELQPCYAQISQQELDLFYMKRNTRAEITLTKIIPLVTEENEAKLKLQKRTNASFMAAEKSEYLPLPSVGTTMLIEAVQSKQEVYEGEELITLCKVTTEEGCYYAEAKKKTAFHTGTVWLELVIEETVYEIPVEVICYPRIVKCVNGHEYVNTEECVMAVKETGVIHCPYCAVYPDRIECSENLLYKKTGCKLTGEELWLDVYFMDGHLEQITPDSEEWQDDYDENYCGMQLVTICYRGLEDIVTIVSENGTCRECMGNCNERSFNDYISFPYCTECMSKVLLFTGKTCYEEQETQWNELVGLLEKNGEILLNSGEYITVILKRNGIYKSLLQRMVKKDGKSGEEE